MSDLIKATGAARPASPPDVDKSWNGFLAPLVREILYAPDGKPPDGWTLAQDLRVCKLWLVRRKDESPPDIEMFLRGLRKLYPTGKLTLRLLMADKDGSLYRRAMAAHYQTTKRGPSKIGVILAVLAKRGAA